jgi:hypothetical protein
VDTVSSGENHLKFSLAKIGSALTVMLASPLCAQYGGPAILARGEAPAAMAAPQVDFRPYVEVGAVYDSGLAVVAVNSQGQIATANSLGASLVWGISGSHSWRHTRLGLDYRGGLYRYGQQAGYDSFENTLFLGLTQELSRHVKFLLRQGAGISNAIFPSTNLRETVPFDPSTAYVPITDYFNTRTTYLTSQMDLIYQRTLRLSFDFGGDLYLTRYTSTALYGFNGAVAHGDVQYRLGRHSTIGAQYLYDHFWYPRIYGGTNVNAVLATYGLRLSRTVEVTGFAGFMRIETLNITSAPVDPVIAALLGISSAPEVSHTINYRPDLAGRFSKTFHKGVLYVNGGHSVNPGNGLFLTSTLTQVAVGYAYTGLRRWSFAAGAGQEWANTISLVNGTYSDTNQSVTLSRQLIPSVHLILSYMARQFRSPQFPNYDRNASESRVAIGYSPGDIPIRVW